MSATASSRTSFEPTPASWSWIARTPGRSPRKASEGPRISPSSTRRSSASPSSCPPSRGAPATRETSWRSSNRNSKWDGSTQRAPKASCATSRCGQRPFPAPSKQSVVRDSSSSPSARACSPGRRGIGRHSCTRSVVPLDSRYSARLARMKAAPRLGAIFLTVFVDLLGFGLVLPFLAKEARDTFGVREFNATLLGSVYSLMQFLFVPVWGRLSDRVGRRPVLLWSIAGTSLAMAGLGAGLAWGHSIAWLFAARAFGGIATANLGTASAYIADVTKPEERARGMGLIGMAFGLGFILGPGIGGALAKIPDRKSTRLNSSHRC